MHLKQFQWFYNHWLGTEPSKRGESEADWLCSPILAKSHFSLAPASVHVAEMDPSRSQAEEYNKKLHEAGTRK